jgi:hypothetical protein
MKKHDLNQLTLNHSFVNVDLIFDIYPIHKSCLVKLFKQYGNGVKIISIAGLLTQEVIIGFLVQNKSLMLMLEKSLTLYIGYVANTIFTSLLNKSLILYNPRFIDFKRERVKID